MKRMKKDTILMTLLLGWFSAGAALAVQWTAGGSPDLSWGNATNWDTGVPGVGAPIVFDAAGSVGASGTVTNRLDTTYTTGNLTYQQTNGVWHTTDLNGNALNVGGGVKVNGNLGAAPAATTSGANVTISGGTVNLGSLATPQLLEVGRRDSNHAAATLTFAPGTALNAYLSELNVAYNGNNSVGTIQAALNLSGATVTTGGFANELRAPLIRVGRGGGANTRGTLTLPTSLTKIVTTGDLLIGQGVYTAGTIDLTSSASQLNTITVGGNFEFDGNFGYYNGTDYVLPAVALSVGTAGNRKYFYMGLNGTDAVGSTLRTLLKPDPGSSLAAYLTDLRVGGNDWGHQVNAIGILDLRDTTITAFSATGTMKIGVGNGGGATAGSKGYVYLPSGTVDTQNLQLGYFTDAAHQSVWAYLELNKTAFTVNGTFSLGGLHPEIRLNSVDPNTYFRVLGNQLTTLQNDIALGYITAAAGAPLAYYNAGDGYTYVVPEPATFSLLAFGGLALLRRRR